MTRPEKDATDVGHGQMAHEQLGELEHPRGDRTNIAFQSVVAALAGELGIDLPDHPDARRRRGDDHVEGVEDAHEAPRERRGLDPVPAVGVELTAARLVARELHLMPEALEHADGRLAHLRKDRVGDAGDEQCDAHARVSGGRPARRRRRR